MAAFHSLPKSSLIALTHTGGVVAGDIYYANDTNETFLGMTGESGQPGIAPLSSLILTGQYQLAGPPSTVPGPQGPQGEPGTPASLAQTIAMAISLS